MLTKLAPSCQKSFHIIKSVDNVLHTLSCPIPANTCHTLQEETCCGDSGLLSVFEFSPDFQTLMFLWFSTYIHRLYIMCICDVCWTPEMEAVVWKTQKHFDFLKSRFWLQAEITQLSSPHPPSLTPLLSYPDLNSLVEDSGGRLLTIWC